MTIHGTKSLDRCGRTSFPSTRIARRWRQIPGSAPTSGLPSEGLRNEEAQRKVHIPETREKLRVHLGFAADDDDFQAALHEHCYDLHYAPVEGARPYSFGIGHLWRIAVDWPGSAVPRAFTGRRRPCQVSRRDCSSFAEPSRLHSLG